MDCFDQNISQADNEALCVIPNEDEIRRAIFCLNSSSALGPDGFGAAFYQSCWNIIKKKFIDVVKSFFQWGGINKVLHLFLPRSST